MPEAEVFADGIDQACNGWGDELGVGEPAAAAASIVVLGQPGWELGWSVDAGVDAKGMAQVAIGGWNVAALDPVPVDEKLQLVVKGETDNRLGYALRVVRWAVPLAGSDIGPGVVDAYGGAGVLAPDDQWAELHELAFGFEVGDLDGDGVEELLTSSGGDIEVWAPPAAGEFADPILTVTSDYTVSQNFAYQIGEIGDLTGDGLPEITAYQEDDAIGGRAFILPGNLTGTVLNTDVGWSLAGEEPNAQAGYAIALGDANGDGYLDLLTGAILADERGGRAYLVPGPIVADGLLAEASVARFDNLYDHDFCGSRVETLPDQDGDGTDEVVIGCSRDWSMGPDMPGRVEVYAGAHAIGILDAHAADRVLVGAFPYDLFGFSITADGDATGDGVPDLVVGAPIDQTGGWTNPPSYAEKGPMPAGAVFVFASPLW